MSKYDPLWSYIKENGADKLTLSFAEIEKIAGLPIDHSFLTFKKELLPYGYKVGKAYHIGAKRASLYGSRR